MYIVFYNIKYLLGKYDKTQNGENTMKLLLNSFLWLIISQCILFAHTATMVVYDGERPVQEKLKFRCEKSYKMTQQSDGAWRVVIPKEEIPLDANVVDVIADFATAKKGEDGYWVFPDGRLGGFHQENGAAGSMRKLKTVNVHRIYPQPIMSMFGMKKSDSAFVAIIKGLNLEHGPVVVAKDGVYKVFPRFFIKQMDTTKPYEDIVIDYYFLEGDDANYSGMARKYRQYQLNRGFVKPLRERAKNNKQLQYTASSIFVRVKHGWKALNTEQKKKKMYEHQTRENEPPIKVNISFDRFMNIMREMKSLGIDNVEICSVGGTAGGFDGRFPDVLPIPEEFGGEAKMREAVKLGQSLGYQMVCHFATTAMFKVSKDWNPDYICKKSNGDMLTSGIVAGGRTHRLCPEVYVEKFLKRDWDIFKDIGFKGTHHIDVISCIIPYVCLDKNHSLNRKQSAEYMNEIARYSREVFGGFGSEGPFDWVASNLDFALYTTPASHSKLTIANDNMVDCQVPLWQLVYHGIIVSNPFYSTIDPTFDRKVDEYSDSAMRYAVFENADVQMLKVVEYGGRPVFYYVSYKNLKPIKKAHDIYEKVKYLQYEYMDFHKEIAPNVFPTKYSNGHEIVCNYNKNPFKYKGVDVKPVSFEIFK